MPVTRQADVAYVLVKLEVDMLNMFAKATLRMTVDGVPMKDFDVMAEGQEFVTLLSQPPAPDVPRGAEVTLAVYNYAISKGIISGTVS